MKVQEGKKVYLGKFGITWLPPEPWFVGNGEMTGKEAAFLKEREEIRLMRRVVRTSIIWKQWKLQPSWNLVLTSSALLPISNSLIEDNPQISLCKPFHDQHISLELLHQHRAFFNIHVPRPPQATM